MAASHFARSLVSVYLAVGVNGALGLLSVPIGLRYLGAEGYGLFSLYTLMVSYVLMADLGISKNLLALLSRHRDPESQLESLRTAAGLYSCLCVAWLALIPLLLWLVPSALFPVGAAHKSTLRWLTVLAIAEFVVGVPQSMAQTACLAREGFGQYSRFTMISGALRNSILIAGSVAFRSPLGLAAAIFLRKFIDLTLAYCIMGPVPWSVWRPRLPGRSAVAMLAQSGTLSIAQVLYSSVMAAGSYLVNAEFGLYWLGLYRVAFDLAGKVSVIVNGITLVLFPKLAYAFGSAGRRVAMSRIVRPALEASWTFCSTLGACAVIGAGWLLPRMGITQPEAIMLFVLLAIGLSINCHTLLTNEFIQASGRYRNSILVSLSALATIVMVFWALHRAMGPTAIGVAWIVAAVTAGGIADSVVLSSLGVGTRLQGISGMKKVLTFLICMSTLAWYFGFAIRQTPALAIGALLFLLIRQGKVLLRAMKSEDLQDGSAVLTSEPVVAA
jgi:O-antigen/teichoic acid export membrane protein